MRSQMQMSPFCDCASQRPSFDAAGSAMQQATKGTHTKADGMIRIGPSISVADESTIPTYAAPR